MQPCCGLGSRERIRAQSWDAACVVPLPLCACEHNRAGPHWVTCTAGSLVKALEEAGIGRPSTYAPTLQLLQQRGCGCLRLGTGCLRDLCASYCGVAGGELFVIEVLSKVMPICSCVMLGIFWTAPLPRQRGDFWPPRCSTALAATCARRGERCTPKRWAVYSPPSCRPTLARWVAGRAQGRCLGGAGNQWYGLGVILAAHYY